MKITLVTVGKIKKSFTQMPLRNTRTSEPVLQAGDHPGGR